MVRVDRAGWRCRQLQCGTVQNDRFCAFAPQSLSQSHDQCDPVSVTMRGRFAVRAPLLRHTLSKCHEWHGTGSNVSFTRMGLDRWCQAPQSRIRRGCFDGSRHEQVSIVTSGTKILACSQVAPSGCRRADGQARWVVVGSIPRATMCGLEPIYGYEVDDA